MRRYLKSLLPAAVALAGLVLLAASFIGSLSVPAEPNWTPKKGSRLIALSNEATDLQQKLHAAQAQPSMHAGENPAELLERFRRIDAEYKELYREFKSATTPAPVAAATYVRWLGVAFVVAGAIIVFANRS